MDCLQLVQQRESSFTDNLGAKAIFVHDDIAGSRSTEALQAQHVAALTHIPLPSLRYTRLDGKPRMNRRRQLLIAVVLGLGAKQFPARHVDDARLHPPVLQRVLSRQDQRHLRRSVSVASEFLCSNVIIIDAGFVQHRA